MHNYQLPLTVVGGRELPVTLSCFQFLLAPTSNAASICSNSLQAQTHQQLLVHPQSLERTVNSSPRQKRCRCCYRLAPNHVPVMASVLLQQQHLLLKHMHALRLPWRHAWRLQKVCIFICQGLTATHKAAGKSTASNACMIHVHEALVFWGCSSSWLLQFSSYSLRLHLRLLATTAFALKPVPTRAFDAAAAPALPAIRVPCRCLLAAAGVLVQV